MFAKPPLTLAKVPLAVFTSPPLTLDPPPLAVLVAPPTLARKRGQVEVAAADFGRRWRCPEPPLTLENAAGGVISLR